MMWKIILKNSDLEMRWTKERWEWESLMRKVYRENLEDKIWTGVGGKFNEEWEEFLYGWMMKHGEFFIVRNRDGGVIGGCWVTDIEDGDHGNFHFVSFENAKPGMIRRNLPKIMEKILAFGLDKKHKPHYRYLIGTTAYESVARLMKSYGFGGYERVEGAFGNLPGFRQTISEENSHGWRRRRAKAPSTAETAAAASTSADQGIEGCGVGATGRTGTAEA